jgi:hypothetical protein
MSNNLSAQGGPARSGKIIGVVAITVVIAMGFSGCNDDKKSVGQEVGENNQQQEKQQVENQIKKTEIILKFERYLRENGEEIQLEKLNTEDWKTYTDSKRGFSFQYPESWYVFPIDLSKELEKQYNSRMQAIEKKMLIRGANDINGHDVKALLNSYPILCVTSNSSFKKISENEYASIGVLTGRSLDKCNIMFKESVPRLKQEKRTSGEIWMENYINKGGEYLNNGKVYIDSTDVGLGSFQFIAKTKSMILAIDRYSLKESKSDIPIFHTMLQTLKYTK